MISDNRTAFVYDEIRIFYEQDGFQTDISAAYHAVTIAQVVPYVAELKNALIQDTTCSMQHRPSRFFFRRHTTVHTMTGVTPAKTMFGQELPSPLQAILTAAVAAANSGSYRNTMP